MVDETQNNELAAFFDAAKEMENSNVSDDLMARVLGDAASIGMEYVADETSKPQPFFQRFFAPIGGFRGAFALAGCACFGMVVGLGDAETLYALPVMGDLLASFSGDLGSFTTFDSLDILMAES